MVAFTWVFPVFLTLLIPNVLTSCLWSNHAERAARCQEEVGFDVPTDAGGTNLTWQGVLYLLLFAAACGGGWKLLIWFLESRRERIRWRRVRCWWPAAMVAWGWIMFGLGTLNVRPEWLFVPLCVMFVIVNLPALILTGIILQLFPEPAGWLSATVGSIAIWVGGYIMVRLAKWRAWANAPTSLHLADSDLHGS